MDLEGRVAIEPTYEWAGDFAGEHAAVKKGARWAIIDRKGTTLEELTAEQAGVAEGVAVYGKEGRWEFKKVRGAQIPGVFREAGLFGGGLAPVKREGAEWTFIKTDGTDAGIGKFARAWPFAFGRAMIMVRRDGQERFGVIDPRGKFVVRPRYKFLFPQSCDTYQFETPEGRVGLVFADGKELVAK